MKTERTTVLCHEVYSLNFSGITITIIKAPLKPCHFSDPIAGSNFPATTLLTEHVPALCHPPQQNYVLFLLPSLVSEILQWFGYDTAEAGCAFCKGHQCDMALRLRLHGGTKSIRISTILFYRGMYYSPEELYQSIGA